MRTGGGMGTGSYSGMGTGGGNIMETSGAWYED